MSRNAKDNPATPNKYLDMGDESVGQDKERVMRSTGPAQEALDPLSTEAVSDIEIFSDVPYDEKKMAELQFMEEMVEVVVHDSTDRLAPPIPEVWNDGRVQRFQRGRAQLVKRKFIEVLARCRRTSYTQRTERDENGDDVVINIPHTSLMYPFSVGNDTQKGRAWLNKIRQEA